MRFLRLLIVVCALLCHTTLEAQRLVLPNIDLEAFNQEAMAAVQTLPRKGGIKKNETYFHLYFFGAQKRNGVEWSDIKSRSDFIRAIDLQSPVQFDDREQPTNIYADYIYDISGMMRWVYADGKATKVNPKQAGNSPQNILVEIAKQQYQMVFVLKESNYSDQFHFFGIRDGEIFMTRHIIWEAYDTYSISSLIEDNNLERFITGKKKSLEEQMKEGVEEADSLTVMPTFMGGGLNKFRAWFMDEFNTSALELDFGETSVVLKFSVDTEGFVDNVEILSCDNIELAQQAVEIVKRSPQWTAGYRGDEAVKTYFQLPIKILIEPGHQSYKPNQQTTNQQTLKKKQRGYK